MKKIIQLLWVLLICNSVTGCHCIKKTPSDVKKNAEAKRDFEKEGYSKAIAIHYIVDGCTFLLQLTDGKKLQPTNLPVDFQKDNLNVWIKYTSKKGSVGVCMAAEMVELSDIQLRE